MTTFDWFSLLGFAALAQLFWKKWRKRNRVNNSNIKRFSTNLMSFKIFADNWFSAGFTRNHCYHFRSTNFSLNKSQTTFSFAATFFSSLNFTLLDSWFDFALCPCSLPENEVEQSLISDDQAILLYVKTNLSNWHFLHRFHRENKH